MILWIPDPSYAYSQCWETTTDNNRLSTSDKVQDISVCNICDSTWTRLSWSVWDTPEAFTARYGTHYHYSTTYVWSIWDIPAAGAAKCDTHNYSIQLHMKHILGECFYSWSFLCFHLNFTFNVIRHILTNSHSLLQSARLCFTKAALSILY